MSRVKRSAVVVLALAGAAEAQLPLPERDIAALIEQLRDDDSADRAIERLRAHGKAVVSALGQSVVAGEEPARSRALLVLRQLGSAAVEAVPDLVTALESSEAADGPLLYDTLADIALVDALATREVRDRMHGATERLLQTADEETGRAIRHGFVRALIRMQFRISGLGALYHFEDNFVIAREYAAEQGGASGSEQILPALRRQLETPIPARDGGRARAFGEKFETSDRVLMKSAWAVERITGERFENVHRHRYWLRYGALQDRIAAALALAQDPSYAQQSLPDLIRALEDPSPRLAREAITALGIVGPPAKEALPTLERLTGHVDRQVAERARVAVRQIRDGNVEPTE